MAKYVYHIPKGEHGSRQALKSSSWGELALNFGQSLQIQLIRDFKLDACVFPDEDGVELNQGSAGMGKDWFNFRFRVFADRAIYLDMINVPYAWRNKGIGAMLIRELQKFAGENGLYYIFLGSYDPSNSFWESHGFKKVTDYPDFVVGPDGMAK
ncbi:MAG TPA: GNAT family N-acetyltransferase [Desulfobacteria bacterium]|nr:GNAT family N-acetyltransferase [Desulfobacteria bacterium]